MSEQPRQVQVRATNFDGTHHWSHPARLVEARDDLVITATQPGLEVQAEGRVYVSPYNTRAHYWPDRWYNAIRLENPDGTLSGWYCNVASPGRFDGECLHYVDLQLDVRVSLVDGALVCEVRDEDEFEAARQRYGYDEAMVERCWAAVHELIALVEQRQFPFDEPRV